METKETERLQSQLDLSLFVLRQYQKLRETLENRATHELWQPSAPASEHQILEAHIDVQDTAKMRQELHYLCDKYERCLQSFLHIVIHSKYRRNPQIMKIRTNIGKRHLFPGQ